MFMCLVSWNLSSGVLKDLVVDLSATNVICCLVLKFKNILSVGV